MKPRKNNLILQRELIEKKLRPWLLLRQDRKPGSGWIKAIRGALGMTARQLAERMEIAQPNVAAYEKREARGAITLEALEKAASAMSCKLVYAIVPNEEYESLNDLLDRKAEEAASSLSQTVSHSMALESQELSAEERRSSIERLAKELKNNMDPRIWEAKPRGRRSK
jgi:predicted DNA-binding mobile mystery protein A